MSDRAVLRSVDPTTEREIGAYPETPADAVDSLLDRAVAAQRAWARRPVAERSALLRRLAAELRRDIEASAELITREMGKPRAEARAEVEKCAFACDYMADSAPGFLADEPAPSDSANSRIAYQPLGVVLAGMPWNYPYWQVFRFASTALVAGNAGVLKHANNTTGCALRIQELFERAGFPDGVFTSLVLPVQRVAALIADPRITAVTLTGSTAAGRSVAAEAGRNLKKCVLELGGSDAFIVLDDADVEKAAETGVKARFQNCGQSCIAAKRFIVVDAVADAFEEAFVGRVRELRVGDPHEEATNLGPLARGDLRDNLEGQIQRTREAGGRIATGGERPDRPGYFLSPAVLLDCPPDSVAMCEETFGPLAAVARVPDERAAIALANATEYGLGGNVWSRDVERGMRVASELESGGVFINGMTHSDPRLPFGGVKSSGYGRELYRPGIHEFVNVKTIWQP